MYRNRDLVTLFEGVETIGINRVTPRFVEFKCDRYSEAFEARRAGEVLRWAMDRGIVERIVEVGQPAWRILNREMHYLAIGPAKRQQAIRVRGRRGKPAGEPRVQAEVRIHEVRPWTKYRSTPPILSCRTTSIAFE
ncbi:hypothetical protein [Devosia sp. CAU 1758]